MAQQALAATTTATTVLAANPSRLKGGLIFENTDTNRCFILLGDPAISGAASSTNYSLSLATNTTSAPIVGYSGIVQVVWGTASTGKLMITEWLN